jgi:hypothetical protein
MDYADVLLHLAPCGLSCRKCMANVDGPIRANSSALQQSLRGFERMAERFAGFMPVLANYPAFAEVLEFFAQADCRGCRSGNCKFFDCSVMSCHKEKGVDFCFQCDEFPCDKTNFHPDLRARWLKTQTRMKEIGVEAYYEETRDLPRYG